MPVAAALKQKVLRAVKEGDIAAWDACVAAGWLPEGLVGSEPALHAAVRYRQVPLLAHLLTTTTLDVHQHNELDQTPMWMAAYAGQLDLVEVLLTHGARVQSEDSYDEARHPFIAACVRHSLPVFERMLQEPLPHTVLDRGLRIACVHQHPEYVTRLLAKGAEPSPAWEPRAPEEPLLFAAARVHHNEPCLNLLLEAGLDVHTQDAAGHWLWHALFRQGVTLESIALLSAHGFDWSRPDAQGHQVLVFVLPERREVLEALIGAGAPLDALSNDGQSPLHAAVSYQSLEAVQVLLDAGANVTTRNSRAQSALHLALIEGHVPIAHALWQAGARLHTDELVDGLLTEETRQWRASIQWQVQMNEGLIAPHEGISGRPRL